MLEEGNALDINCRSTGIRMKMQDMGRYVICAACDFNYLTII